MEPEDKDPYESFKPSNPWVAPSAPEPDAGVYDGDPATVPMQSPEFTSIPTYPDPAFKAPEPGPAYPDPVFKAPEPEVKAPEPEVKAPEPDSRAPERGFSVPQPAAQRPPPAGFVRSPSPAALAAKPMGGLVKLLTISVSIGLGAALALGILTFLVTQAL